MRKSVRILATLASTCVLLGSIGVALWQADGRYSLPTPRPDSLVQSANLAPELLARLRAAAGARSPAQPLLVHFYNPGCPCSRFNREHVLELVRDFGARVAQLALVELPEGEPSGALAFDEELGMSALSESDGALARALGVYSTPQAVLIDAAGKVYFRGNYNQSRYCTREESAYARIALAALLAGRPCPPLPEEALRAYGCELPNEAWKPGTP